MDETITSVFNEYFTKLTSIALKVNMGYIGMEESKELLRVLNQKTLSSIHHIRVAGFVTDN